MSFLALLVLVFWPALVQAAPDACKAPPTEQEISALPHCQQNWRNAQAVGGHSGALTAKACLDAVCACRTANDDLRASGEWKDLARYRDQISLGGRRPFGSAPEASGFSAELLRVRDTYYGGRERFAARTMAYCHEAALKEFDELYKLAAALYVARACYRAEPPGDTLLPKCRALADRFAAHAVTGEDVDGLAWADAKGNPNQPAPAEKAKGLVDRLPKYPFGK